MNISEEKKSIRSHYIGLRLALSVDERARLDGEICDNVIATSDFSLADVILCYYPISKKGEVDVLPIAKEALRLGKTVAFPVCLPDTRKMIFKTISSFDDFSAGNYGITEPTEDCKEVNFSELLESGEETKVLCLMPGAVFDVYGGRIGYGGGYYDRFFDEIIRLKRKDPHSRLSIVSIAPTYSICLSDKPLPSDIHDIKTDVIITEKGVIS